ncbi:MAG TPA: hypothetical protein DCE81_08965 [Cytophagales bacterium]|nr:hypothetical protein [Cytophagales bacterium]
MSLKSLGTIFVILGSLSSAWAQQGITPDNLLISLGSYQMTNKETKVGNIATNSFEIGAEWRWETSDRYGLNSSIIAGLYFPTFTFSQGVRPYILIPITFYYQANSKLRFNAGLFFRGDFYSNFREPSFDSSVESTFYDWELPVTKTLYFGASGSIRYFVSDRLSCSVDLYYIPSIGVKEVSNNPDEPTQNHFSLSPKLSVYFGSFRPKE